MRMMIALLVLLGVVGVTSARDVQVRKSSDQTSASVPLTFTPDRAWSESGYLKVQGTVKNTGSSKLEYVKVTITIKDSSNSFIQRENAYTDPTSIGPGQVGYVNFIVLITGKEPSLVEYVITAN